jgi:hypothetical protein
VASMQPYSTVEAGDMIIRDDGPWRVNRCDPHPDGKTYVIDMTHMHTKKASFIRVAGTARVKVL